MVLYYLYVYRIGGHAGCGAARALRARVRLLCMGLFSRFLSRPGRAPAEGTLCRGLDTRSFVPRAYETKRSNSSINGLVPEMPDAGEDHRHLAFVSGGDRFFVAHRTARLNRASGAGISGRD